MVQHRSRKRLTPLSHASSRRRFLAGTAAAVAVTAGILPAPAGGAMPDALPARIDFHGTPLRLFSTSVREIAWIEIYRCALYLPAEARPPSDPERLDTPLAFHITVLRDHDDPELPDTWERRLRAAVSQQVFSRLDRTYRALAKSDAVTVAFAPGQGTTVRRNGETVVQTPDGRLMSVFLAQWLGPEAVSADLRRELRREAAERDADFGSIPNAGT
jgi:hypothetical protein